MLPRKCEGSGRHAAREFQEGNDGSGECYSANENAEIGSDELKSSEINEKSMGESTSGTHTWSIDAWPTSANTLPIEVRTAARPTTECRALQTRDKVSPLIVSTRERKRLTGDHLR